MWPWPRSSRNPNDELSPSTACPWKSKPHSKGLLLIPHRRADGGGVPAGHRGDQDLGTFMPVLIAVAFIQTSTGPGLIGLSI